MEVHWLKNGDYLLYTNSKLNGTIKIMKPWVRGEGMNKRQVLLLEYLMKI